MSMKGNETKTDEYEENTVVIFVHHFNSDWLFPSSSLPSAPVSVSDSATHSSMFKSSFTN